ncbi:MAG: multidrug efflux pump subunit AcrB [Myxococcota bacterium]|jgi:multidrug efflux pump subunit AcrB
MTRALLFATGLTLILGCANCGAPDPVDPVEVPAEQPGPSIQLSMPWPGASATEIERMVIAPIERTLKRDKDSGIAHTWSQSGGEQARLTIDFESGVTKAAAEDAVRAALEAVRRMPSEVGEPVVSVGAAPTAGLRLRLSGTDTDALVEAARALTEELEAMPGVREATPSIGHTSEVEVKLDDERMRAAGLRTLGVTQQLSASGLIEQNNVEALQGLMLKSRDGKEVALQDVATIQLNTVPTRLDRYDGNRVAWITIDADDSDTLRVALGSLASPHPAVRVTVD